MNTPQLLVRRNGYDFVFYDYNDNEDVQTMVDYMYYLYRAINFKRQDRLIFVGDSNLKNAFDHSQENYNLLNYDFEVFPRGGLRASQLREIYPRIVPFRYICIMLGGNDLNTTSDETLLSHFISFIEHLPAENYVVRIVQLFSRKDQDPENVKAFNAKLKRALPKFYHPCGPVVRANFRDSPIRERCHLKAHAYHKLIKLMGIVANNMFCNTHNAAR